MQNRLIPNTAISVSPLCLGTMTFGAPVPEAEAIRLVQSALDIGINFFDTANIYEGYSRVVGSAGGVAEIILGKALQGRRAEAIVATKVGMKVGLTPEDEGTSPAAIRAQLDKSLERLAMDYVDIYYLHRPDPNEPMADILCTMAEAMRQGKIRHFGISNYSAEQTAKMLKVADQNHLPRPVIHQPPYSLLKRDIERDLLPLCMREKIAVAPYQVLQGGLLTGKYRRNNPPPVDSRKTAKPAWLPEFDDALFDRLECLEKEALAQGRSLACHAVRAILEQPAVVSVILGARNFQQVSSFMECLTDVKHGE